MFSQSKIENPKLVPILNCFDSGNHLVHVLHPNPKSKIENPKSIGRQRKEKPAALSNLALQPNFSAVHLDELLRQCQP